MMSVMRMQGMVLRTESNGQPLRRYDLVDDQLCGGGLGPNYVTAQVTQRDSRSDRKLPGLHFDDSGQNVDFVDLVRASGRAVFCILSVPPQSGVWPRSKQGLAGRLIMPPTGMERAS
jgi:hypothetical protein